MKDKIINEYKILQKIGNGELGEVYEAMKDQKYYAIQFINLHKIKKDKIAYLTLKKEIKIRQQISNKNIIKVYESFEINILDEDYQIIVMEKCDKNDLSHFIYSDNYKPNNENTFNFIKQILLALKEIHNHNIIHRYRIL